MTQPAQPSTTRTHATGWPPWRTWFIAGNTVTILTLVAVHAWHAGSGSGTSTAVLGLTRVFFAIAGCAWPVCEINHWNNRRSTAAVHTEIRALHGAVDQLRRQLSADMAGPLGQLAAAVEKQTATTGEHLTDMARRIDASQHQAYWRGYSAGAGDAETNGNAPNISRLPRKGGNQISTGTEHLR